MYAGISSRDPPHISNWGVRGGAYKKTKASTENVSLTYVAPLVSVGYEYLITDLHLVLNNHFGVKIGMTSLIPIKKELHEPHLL